ncbi:MAG: hypothetical protein J2P24_05275 [Streptosporangiales bacterium]|nr:hypothetical protein [Streptosporangiales bacterium]MBO0889392.1 hypothetical protein [Acidothermales bacterium]
MSTAADWLPSLSRGRHRDPREGGCFMEVASWLADEPWSDHPSCTHPLLAQVAREVNDHSTDAGRRALAPMIPDVIGANPADPGVAPRLVLVCAAHALPFATGALRHELEWARCRAARRVARMAGRRDVRTGRLTSWWRFRAERDYLLDATCAVDHAVCALTRDRGRADERMRALLAVCIRVVTGDLPRVSAAVLTETPYGIQSSPSSR